MSIALQKDSENQIDKVIPESFLKIEEWGGFVEAKDRRERDS